MRARAGFTRLVDASGAIIFSVIVLVASAQIINRYFFGSSFVFAEEMAVQLMIWIAFLGAAKCVSEDSHTRLSFVVEKLPPTAKLAAMLLSNALSAGFLGIAAWYGFKLVATTWRGRTIGTQVPEGLIYLAMPACSVVMIVFLIGNSIDTVRRFRAMREAAR